MDRWGKIYFAIHWKEIYQWIVLTTLQTTRDCCTTQKSFMKRIHPHLSLVIFSSLRLRERLLLRDFEGDFDFLSSFDAERLLLKHGQKNWRQNDGTSFNLFLEVHTVSCRINYLHINLCPKCNSATNSTEKKKPRFHNLQYRPKKNNDWEIMYCNKALWYEPILLYFTRM